MRQEPTLAWNGYWWELGVVLRRKYIRDCCEHKLVYTEYDWGNPLWFHGTFLENTLQRKISWIVIINIKMEKDTSWELTQITDEGCACFTESERKTPEKPLLREVDMLPRWNPIKYQFTWTETTAIVIILMKFIERAFFRLMANVFEFDEQIRLKSLTWATLNRRIQFQESWSTPRSSIPKPKQCHQGYTRRRSIHYSRQVIQLFNKMNQSFVMLPGFFDPPTTICGNVHHFSSGRFGCVEGEEEEEDTKKHIMGFRYSESRKSPPRTAMWIKNRITFSCDRRSVTDDPNIVQQICFAERWNDELQPACVHSRCLAAWGEGVTNTIHCYRKLVEKASLPTRLEWTMVAPLFRSRP